MKGGRLLSPGFLWRIKRFTALSNMGILIRMTIQNDRLAFVKPFFRLNQLQNAHTAIQIELNAFTINATFNVYNRSYAL